MHSVVGGRRRIMSGGLEMGGAAEHAHRRAKALSTDMKMFAKEEARKVVTYEYCWQKPAFVSPYLLLTFFLWQIYAICKMNKYKEGRKKSGSYRHVNHVPGDIKNSVLRWPGYIKNSELRSFTRWPVPKIRAT